MGDPEHRDAEAEGPEAGDRWSGDPATGARRAGGGGASLRVHPRWGFTVRSKGMRDAPGTRSRIERARISWKVIPANSGELR
ncbi:hypothetical protein GCM10027162_51580 [Streptomyces incanus]